MGVDPAIGGVKARAPRKMTDRFPGRRMWAGVLAVGLVMGVASLATVDIFLPGGLVDGADSLDVARTPGFTTLVLAQVFTAFHSRSDTASAFHRLFVNKWLWGAVLLAAALQLAVVELSLLQRAFTIASLDPMHWALCIATACIVLWLDELRKLLYRMLERNTPGKP